MSDTVILPPLVYVPVGAAMTRATEAAIEYRMTKDGRKVLLAYSALDRLVDAMGNEQPWIACPAAALQELGETDRFDVTLLDVAVPVEQRRRFGG